MIIVLFLKNDKIGSRLIQWGTRREDQSIDEVPSHVAFLFEVNGEKTVIDSTLTSGVRETDMETINEHYEILDRIPLGFSAEESYRYLEKARRKLVGKLYDTLAIAYFSWRVALFKFFKVKIPTKSWIQFKFMWFCSEVYGFFTGRKENMTSPNDLLFLLKEKA